MKPISLGGVLLVALLAGMGIASAQSQGGYQGGLPDGEADRSLQSPTPVPPTPMPRLDDETVRSLLFNEPADLTTGFGTVTRHSDGSVERHGSAPEPRDQLRKRGWNARPNIFKG